MPESCADCAYFRHDTFPCTVFTVCFCEQAQRVIPDEDVERPVWCPLNNEEDIISEQRGAFSTRGISGRYCFHSPCVQLPSLRVKKVQAFDKGG